MKFARMGRIAAMMTLALAVASCEHVETPTDVGSAEYAGEPQELLSGLLGGLLDGETTIRAVDQYGTVRTYTLVRESILTNVVGTVVQTADGLLATVTKLLGADGGTLRLVGHRLVVPSGAVDAPTTFEMSALLNGNVRVDLSATAPGASGRIDVGEAGFDRPVRLDLTYERATNVRDARKLVIIRLNPLGMDAVHEVLPTTVDPSNERATTWLEHFSGYIMAQ